MGPLPLFNTCGPCDSCFAAGKCGGSDAPYVAVESHPNRLSLNHPQLPDIIRDIGGLDFGAVTIPATDWSQVSSHIPQANGRWVPGMGCYPPVVAVSVSKVITTSGHIRDTVLTAGHICRWLNVPMDTKVILTFFGKDPLLENSWRVSSRTDLWRKLVDLGFWAATSPNFSIYFSENRIEHLVNFRRTALATQLIADAGLPVIPNIYWYRPIDLDRHATWITTNRGIKAVGINFQTYKTPKLLDHGQLSIKLLAERIPDDVHFFLFGLGPARYSQLWPEIRALGSRLHVVNTRAYMLAKKCRRLTREGKPLLDTKRNEKTLFRYNLWRDRRHWEKIMGALEHKKFIA